MNWNQVLIAGLLTVNIIQFVTSATIYDAETLVSDITQIYNKNVRPVYDQSQAVTVSVTMYMKSIQQFDEVNEKFSYVAGLLLSWYDYRLQWNPADYGGLDKITLAYSDVWVPEISLSSPASQSTTVGKSTDRIRYDSDGRAEWFPPSYISSTCSVNVRNFPFETQSCTTSFTSLGYKNDEVNLTMSRTTIDFQVFSPNALWDIIGSETKKVLLGTGQESELQFTIKLKRKSAFVAMTILVPILVLSLLNVLVFILPSESGERIGYCITTLLAIAVYMTIVSDTLPGTSEPVPLISFYLLVGMVCSALIVLVTILSLRLYHKDENLPVPEWLKSVYACLRCSRCRYGKVGSEEVELFIIRSNAPTISKDILRDVRNTTRNKSLPSSTSKDTMVDKIEGPITWKKISHMIDSIAVITFIIISILNFVIFIGLAMS